MEADVMKGQLLQTPEKDVVAEHIEHLIANAKSAIFGAVELHNKPIFPCRYEITVVLTINAWELLMKAYILKYLPEHKLFDDEGKTRPFEKCVSLIHRHLDKEFLQAKASLENLYQYRCDIQHFYGTGIEMILYSLLRPNILYFADFLKQHFGIDLAEEANLIILPIGFKRILSPVDFLSEKSFEQNQHVASFLGNLKKSATNLMDNGFEDGLLCNYSIYIEKEHKVKNADLIVGVAANPEDAEMTVTFNKQWKITKDENAPAIRLDEESIYRDHFNIQHNDLRKWAKTNVEGFKENAKFNEIMKAIRADENCFRRRCLDINPTPRSVYKTYYSELALKRLKEEYEKTT